mmetsp:Transcript_18867/g.37325  ORF Transcript_18867/g.37325 Transcript_18867/m.37325 type:complete len:222 (+) Transcript_18867:507-1172(+)
MGRPEMTYPDAPAKASGLLLLLKVEVMLDSLGRWCCMALKGDFPPSPPAADELVSLVYPLFKLGSFSCVTLKPGNGCHGNAAFFLTDLFDFSAFFFFPLLAFSSESLPLLSSSSSSSSSSSDSSASADVSPAPFNTSHSSTATPSTASHLSSGDSCPACGALIGLGKLEASFCRYRPKSRMYLSRSAACSSKLKGSPLSPTVTMGNVGSSSVMHQRPERVR